MTLAEKTLQTSNGWTIVCRSWTPQNLPPKAIILLLHGIGEHGGRYQHVSEYFISQGFAVWIPDQRGCGRSSNPRRDKVQRYDEMVEDLPAFFAAARQKDGGCPIFLIGHSLGGLTILKAAMDRESFLWQEASLCGILLSSPALGGRVPRYRTWGVRVLASLFPGTHIHFDAGSAYLTHDLEMALAHQRDPFIQQEFTAGFLRDILRTQTKVGRDLRRLPCPLLLLCAGDDRLVDVQATRAFYGRLKGEKEWVCFDAAYHELFNEVQRAEVLTRSVLWMNRILTGHVKP